MPTSPFTSIADLAPQLDALILAGWPPCLNQLKPTDWHVGLMHSTVPPYALIHKEDGTIGYNQDGHRYHIHAHGETLRIALEKAFSEVAALTQPTD